MSRHSIEEYVHGWHAVAQQDYPADNDAGTAARKSLARCERELLGTLPNRPALHGMSANPLLCGLLCSLHLQQGEYLPESRKQVYDTAVDLLLVRWPVLRRRRRAMAEDGAPAGNDRSKLRLSSEELHKLLQRLAFSLVINRELVLEPGTARRRVEAFMVGLRGGDEDPGRVLQYLAEDCGLLRELPDGPLQFVHRTFRDHLAAKEVVDEANLTLMLDNADKPHWHDVVVMSGAHARPAEHLDPAGAAGARPVRRRTPGHPVPARRGHPRTERRATAGPAGARRARGGARCDVGADPAPDPARSRPARPGRAVRA